MKVVVLGSTGQLALSLKKTQGKTADVIYLSHQEAPFENFDAVKIQLEKIKPTHVINAVAYTKVDLAESERDLCLLINCETPSKIASWCKHNNALFVHYSTDYVFNGENEVPWTEENKTDPLNTYGISKMRSEKEILPLGNSYIFRTSWVYSEFGQNFVKTMIRFFKEREALSIVSDQVGAPTYATDLAEATWSVLDKSPKPGLYHLAPPNFCSWFDFANAIHKECVKFDIPMQVEKILPILTKDYKSQAVRPLNSRLSSLKIKKEFQIELPAWEEALHRCVDALVKGQL